MRELTFQLLYQIEIQKEIDEETIERYHSIPWNSIKGIGK